MLDMQKVAGAIFGMFTWVKGHIEDHCLMNPCNPLAICIDKPDQDADTTQLSSFNPFPSSRPSSPPPRYPFLPVSST